MSDVYLTDRSFKRHYGRKEEAKRFVRFKRRYNEVLEHNHISHTRYLLELNKFSDMVGTLQDDILPGNCPKAPAA